MAGYPGRHDYDGGHSMQDLNPNARYGGSSVHLPPGHEQEDESQRSLLSQGTTIYRSEERRVGKECRN